MPDKTKKSVVITDLTKRFNEAVERLVKTGVVANYKEIADAIGWTEASISSTRALRINVPSKYVKSFEKVYKISLTNINNLDIQNRLLRIEANLEVFQVAIAGLKARKSEDFENKFSELQLLIEEAVKRRKMRDENFSS